MFHADYTVVLKSLLDEPTARAKIDAELQTYPLYVTESENPIVQSLIPTREQLNTQLLDAYKYREIGFETVGRFIDELGIAMREIMPKYNQRLKTVEIMNELDNPFDNVDVVENYEETSENASQGQGNVQNQSSTDSEGQTTNRTTGSASSNNNTENDSHSKNVKSSQPQGQLAIGATGIDTVDYADEADWNHTNANAQGSTSEESETESNSDSLNLTETTATMTSESETTSQSTVRHTFSKKGNQGVNTYAHDIIEFRETILNITQEIINDRRIKQLFMMIY